MQKQIEHKQVEKKFIILSKEELTAMQQEAARIGAKTAIEKLEEEKKNLHAKVVNRRFHNTKLLMKNYRMLKVHSENSIFGRSQMEESAADILYNMMNLYDDEVIVDAIKRSATRTAIMVSHINNMLSLYQVYCEKSSSEADIRRYEVIYDMYVSEETMTVNEIARKYNMSKENVYSDIKIAIKKLSALFFGIDGLSAQ